jgi:cytochrome P450/ferredoxin-NADP reductase
MTPPSFDETLFSDAAIRNPWPVYARMREAGAVLWLPALGNFALPRHREVQMALRDHGTFVSSRGVAADQFGCDFLQGNTVASDNERHMALRTAMAQPMLPGALGSIEASVQNAADELIDDLLERGSFDAVIDLARFLPLTIVREMVGLPEFGKDKMLQWAAAAFDVLGVQNQRGVDALPVIAEMREFIQRDATRENLKPGSWTHRIHELVDAGQLSADLAPFAIRDYINPSLDTTISATAELIYQLAANPEQWEILKRNPALADNAVNEAVRLGTPIRAFSRHASRDVEIAGVAIPEGSRVMMLFASANRDERRFDQPDQFDINREARDHVGFGSGIHMCVGMHLAQLEMRALLHAMIPRVGQIETGRPEVKLNNTICAYGSLPCVFTREARVFRVEPVRPRQTDARRWLEARVDNKRQIAEDVVCVDLVSASDDEWPRATAGSHIDVHMAPGLVRQYSLTGFIEPGRYTIAVQKAAESRGGSRWMHQNLEVGAAIKIGAPRNCFALPEFTGTTLLVAGGIGITPLLSMAWQLHQQQRTFELHICARSQTRLPFGDEWHDWPFASVVKTYLGDISSDESDHAFDVASLLVGRTGDVQIMVCGPKGFMQMVCGDVTSAGVDPSRVHLEHFGAEIDPDGEPFTIVAQQSGKTFEVPADKTALQVLREAGIVVPTSCEQGVCGSCLTTVIEGVPDHRDMVQTDAEKAGNHRVALCCSRSRSKRLVLDL